jgi:prolyl-tRNA synthetase
MRNGLVIPPRLAPLQVVIVPVFKTEDELKKISETAEKLMAEHKKGGYFC